MNRAVLVFFALCVATAFSDGGKRLIQTGPDPSNVMWMSPEEIATLGSLAGPMHGTPFMDLTGQAYYPREAKYNATGGGEHALPPHQCFQRINMDRVRENLAVITNRDDDRDGYQNRKHNTPDGRASAVWLHGVAAGYCGSKCEATLYEHVRTPQNSVIVRWTGTQNPDQVVILGAHLDSTASGNRAPGADDDGSGTVTVLEVLKALIDCDFSPALTVEFQLYAAEEVGLWGSQEIANFYRDTGVNVKSMLQFDMNGCCAPNRGLNRGTRFNVCTDASFTNAALTQRLRDYISATNTLPQGNFQYGYAASDHASFARAGFPACHVKENVGYSPIHTANDVYANIDFDYLENFVKVGIQYAFGEA